MTLPPSRAIACQALPAALVAPWPAMLPQATLGEVGRVAQLVPLRILIGTHLKKWSVVEGYEFLFIKGACHHVHPLWPPSTANTPPKLCNLGRSRQKHGLEKSASSLVKVHCLHGTGANDIPLHIPCINQTAGLFWALYLRCLPGACWKLRRLWSNVTGRGA